MLLLLVALAIHVRVSKGLRRISRSCGLCLGSRPSLLLLLRLEISLHEVFIILLPPPWLLLCLTLIAISLVLMVWMARVCLLVHELFVKLSSKLFNIIIFLDMVMSPIVYELLAILFITLIFILLLHVHTWASPISGVLIPRCARLLSWADDFWLRVVGLRVVLILIVLFFLCNVHMASLDTWVLGLSSVAALLLGVAWASLGSLLLTIMKLVADAIVRHAWTHNILEAIIMALYLEWSSDDGLNSIVVTHHLHFVNDAVLAWTRVGGATLRKHFVVVPRNQEMRDGVSSPNLNFTVMAS